MVVILGAIVRIHYNVYRRCCGGQCMHVLFKKRCVCIKLLRNPTVRMMPPPAPLYYNVSLLRLIQQLCSGYCKYSPYGGVQNGEHVSSMPLYAYFNAYKAVAGIGMYTAMLAPLPISWGGGKSKHFMQVESESRSDAESTVIKSGEVRGWGRVHNGSGVWKERASRYFQDGSRYKGVIIIIPITHQVQDFHIEPHPIQQLEMLFSKTDHGTT